MVNALEKLPAWLLLRVSSTQATSNPMHPSATSNLLRQSSAWTDLPHLEQINLCFALCSRIQAILSGTTLGIHTLSCDTEYAQNWNGQAHFVSCILQHFYEEI